MMIKRIPRLHDLIDQLDEKLDPQWRYMIYRHVILGMNKCIKNISGKPLSKVLKLTRTEKDIIYYRD